MINWRNGKAGFVGGLKYAIKGFFQYTHSITSTTVITQGPGLGFSTSMTNNGLAKIGLMFNNGIGETGTMANDGIGKGSTMSNDGIGKVGLITNDGIGKTGEI
jgi:hypothetical protein